MSRRTLLSATVVVASLVAALLVAEVLVRIVLPQRLYYNISQWDPYVGFTLIPNIESRQRNDEYEMSIRINSRGLRDREFPLAKPPRTLRVGVFGDSFTFGEGVEVEQTFPKLLEQRLRQDARLRGAGWQVEVLNFGLGKTGTSHQLALYRQQGRTYGLDVVVLAFLASNDFTDNLSGVFRLEAGQLVHNAEAYTSVRRVQAVLYSIPGYRWMAEHSHLVNLARRVATGLDDRRRLGTIATAGADEAAVLLTERLVGGFRAEVEASGADFLMISLPVRGQREAGQYPAGAVEPPYARRLASLQSQLHAAGVPVIDFLPVFAVLPADAHYYERDGHMRPPGHVVIADGLLPEMQTRLYARLPAQQP